MASGDGSTRGVCWISGASSGIGAALASSAPSDLAVIGVSRRRPAAGRHLPADLSTPDGWTVLGDAFERGLGERPARAVFLHMSGTPGPPSATAAADPDEYRSAILLNAAAPLVLGAAFLESAARHEVPATLVLCSSPAARQPMPGMSCYSSGKVAVEHWVGCVDAELADHVTTKVLAVVPYAVDTPMVRAVIESSAPPTPVAALLAEAAARGQLATAESVAEEIWAATTDAPSGSIVAVGAVPEAERGPERAPR